MKESIENVDHWSRCIHESFLNAYERAKGSARLIKDMPVILMRVVDANEIDAYCEKVEKDLYQITVNSGLYHAIHTLFRTILAHPTTFLSIGNFLFERSTEARS